MTLVNFANLRANSDAVEGWIECMSLKQNQPWLH